MRQWKGNKYLVYREMDMKVKYKRKDLLNMVSSMKKAFEVISAHNNISEEDFVNILTECQNAAIEIGNFVENSFQEGYSIVGELEQYCEAIYQISLLYNDMPKCKQLIKNTKKLLNQIYNDIYAYIPENKKEVIFLPYKASMWDSLESIWMAANARDDIEAYVIPIPYYEKNADGSLGKMHYEGADYPEYVPITDWQAYDIENRRPDAIYIHNPYDDANYVTSVHPKFYSSKLKNYTEMLVYVPYFVAVNDKIVEELCVNPGVLFATKVIVQSEEVRKTYIEEFHKFEKENSCKGIFGVAEEKFLALGSPKYDKILNLKKTDFVLPKEWQDKIDRKDGTTRKIILYNTTIDAMLKNEGMLEKIEQVIETFKQQDDVVLWWRPHPLLQSTLMAMRPQAYEYYMEIVKQFKDEEIGIYDDTVELHRAIAYADAYYGDISSVVELFKQTGKPMMIQNVLKK